MNNSELASELIQAANMIGKSVNKIYDIERSNPEMIAGEEYSSDLIQISGPDIISALRAIAMRLDRAACIKNQ